MKKALSLLLIAFVLQADAQLNYPVTKKADSTQDYHGTVVQDPYRWLEDDWSVETKDWVTAQNKVTFDYL